VRWAIDQLELAASDRVLEIGSGSGLAVALAAERLTRGCITGIDRSALQVSKARALNDSAIAAGRASVEKLSLERAPEVLGDAAFRKVFAINVNAFWAKPGPSLTSLHRLLRRNGRAYLIYEPPSAAKLRELANTLPLLLQQAGFVAVQCRHAPSPAARLICFSGAAGPSRVPLRSAGCL
jgi:cyclopropane fatty-acyl-phospholipid synthase-like methyltransferase